jgi:hypothetical protein
MVQNLLTEILCLAAGCSSDKCNEILSSARVTEQLDLAVSLSVYIDERFGSNLNRDTGSLVRRLDIFLSYLI